MKRLLLLGALIFTVAGCGGGGSTNTPTTPTTPTPPATNRAPTITATTVNPGWGISTLTTHVFTASASDPDGDAIYSWDFANGTSNSSADGSVIYNNANTNTYQATLTARDSKGATTTASVSVTSVTLAGTWAGTIQGSPLSTTLTQYLGGLVDGTWQVPTRGNTGDVGPTGEPGKIQANGQFELRFKVRQGSFQDFYYRGTINPSGQQMTGALQDPGLTVSL